MLRIFMSAMITLLAAVGAVHADTFVPPQDCSVACTPPVVDGVIGQLEYADGRKLPFQDYGVGGPNGALFLLISGEYLHIGIRAHEGVEPSGLLKVWVDAHRADTLDGVPGATAPRTEDREFQLRYKFLGNPTATLVQSRGASGSWSPFSSGPIPNTQAWPVSFQLSRPTNDPGFIHFELRIRMRPARVPIGEDPSSEPITSRRFGLGIEHAAGDSWEILPNTMTTPPQILRTDSWETVLLELPPSIPLSLTTYNVGQMPSVVPDQGSGDPADFAKELWSRDIICLSEVWGEGDPEEMYASINTHRLIHGLDPMNVVGMGWEENDTTGLMLLSARPLLQSHIMEFDNDLCSGWDCWKDKGAIWGRVLLDPPDPAKNIPAGDADRFVDVYCTHLQTGGSEEEVMIRALQMEELMSFINDTREPDRPAFLMGDFNVSGARTGAPSDEYSFMLGTLGIASLSPFDSMNGWLSDTYDLGMLQSPVNGTMVGDTCSPTTWSELPTFSRYDYILALPAPAQWPDYGVAKEPVVNVDPMYRPELDEAQCMSDHALLSANVQLIPAVQPGKWNPMKAHEVTYRVARLVDRASGGCCADWYTPFIGIHDAYESYSDDATPDGTSVNPNWHVSTPLSGTGVALMQVSVYDWDSGDDDHYDCTSSGLDPKFRFSHGSGVWEELDDDYLPTSLLGSFDTHPGGMAYETYGDPYFENHGDVLNVLEAREL